MANPFAQGGWIPGSTSGHGHETPLITIAPTFGALPYPDPAPNPGPSFTTLYFASPTSNILNMTVVDPTCRPQYYVATDALMPNYTVLKDCHDKKIALVEWRSHPCVEIRALLPKQCVRDWLRLSEDKRSRTMDIKGAQYTWTTEGNFLCLFATDKSTPELLARVSKVQKFVNLEISPPAMSLGLQEPILIATLLLQCGMTID